MNLNCMYRSLHTLFKKTDALRLIQKNNYPDSSSFSGLACGHTGYFNFWHGLSHMVYRLAMVLILLLLFSSTSARAGTDGNAQVQTVLQKSSVSQIDSPQVAETSENRALELYGMEYIDDSSDYSVVEDLGIDTIVIEFAAAEGQRDWIAKLDEAEAQGLEVVANYWPEGWNWNEDDNRWDMTERVQIFLRVIDEHPALLAVYGLHEPYWNDCEGCGYTTSQQQKLYSQIKSIIDVPIWSVFSSFEWADQTYGGSDYEFADDVCDYCSTWMYPSLSSIYERKAMVTKLEDELEYFRARTSSAKFIWVLQAFESNLDNTAMPTYKEMMDHAAVAMQYDVDGVTWYTWDFDPDEYPDTLSDDSSLWPAVREVYDNCLRDPDSSECIDLSMQKGDVNCDYQINVVDALAVLQFVADVRSEIGTCQQDAFRATSNSIIGDVNGNGRVDSVDALQLLQCEVGVLNDFCGDRD